MNLNVRTVRPGCSGTGPERVGFHNPSLLISGWRERLVRTYGEEVASKIESVVYPEVPE